MKLWQKYLIVTIIIGLPALALGPLIWPRSSDVNPENWQIPFFVLLAAFEAALFGFGIAFMWFNWKNRKPTALYAAISWLLVSWWPHDNFHINNGLNTTGLLLIDYSFHLTLIIASVVVALNLYKGDKKQK
ncbi:MAG: hypothetical protein AABX51_01875 [Nanoarchaeota archaeon]